MKANGKYRCMICHELIHNQNLCDECYVWALDADGRIDWKYLVEKRQDNES